MGKMSEAFDFTEAERRVFKPKEKITVSEWAERHRVIEKGPAPGQWTNELTPYLVEPMDAWNKPWVQKVFLCFAPQTGKTQVALNCMCYAVDQDPGPAMYIMPDEKAVKRLSKRQILPALKKSPRTAELLSPRVDDVSTLQIVFTNGMDIMMAWATSPSVMASESVRYVFFDEPGKYPEFSGREADPFSLGEVRTNAYPFTKKLMYFSTPNIDGDAFSTMLDEDVDVMHHYEAQCPWCGACQQMEFDSIHWPQDVRSSKLMKRKKLARYACVHCGMDWDDAVRDRAVKSGRWIPENDIDRPVSVGFHLPSWYSPFISLSDVAAAFLSGLKDPSKMMAFVTQHKAEPWKETIKQKNEEELLRHKTDLPHGIVPEWSVALTCGIDVQKYNFYFVVRAWDKDLNSHLVDYGTLSNWAAVEQQVFFAQYAIKGSNHHMPIWRAGIDTGGGMSADGEWSRTEEVYQWVRKNGRGVVFAIKGASRPQLKRVSSRIIDKMQRGNRIIPGGLELRLLDVDQFKRLIHWRMTRNKGETQRFHLHAQTGIDYARQILAEELRKDRRGKSAWHQLRKDNHYLDCEVIAAACADSEWTPSLVFLAQNVADATPEPKQETNQTRQHGGEGRSKPSWFTNRR